MDMNWHHIALAVNNMNRALYFYVELLGFETEWDRPHYKGDAFSRIVGLDDAEAHVVMLRGHGTRIELFRYHNPPGEGRGIVRQCDYGISHFTFAVKKIHELYADLRKAGVVFNCPPQSPRPGVYATYMKDPEGNTIELVQYE